MFPGYVFPQGGGGTTVLSGAVSSGEIASGSVQGFFGPVRNIASGTVGVFDFGSGAVIAGTVGSGAVVSGNIASGQIGSGHLASGLVNNLLWDVEQLATVESVSGLKAVSVTSGGVVALAMAGSGLRLPVVGIVALNYVSGDTASVLRQGKITPTSGLDFRWSGKVGQLLYAGSGGEIVSQSLLVSGQAWQKLGFALSGSMLVQIDPSIFSGGIAGPAGTF